MGERDESLERLAAFPDVVAVAARSADGQPTPDGEWTPELVVRHLIAVDLEVHQRRVTELETQDEPSWSWQEPGPWPDEATLGLDGVLDRFASVRGDTVAMYRALDDGGWTRTGRHATFGQLDADGLLGLVVDHDAEHLEGLI
ncbi:MAG TPA: DinB family protein [Candidatus Limnocylindrales bacterium]|nr:DinB family protein [Candidatus Limnocylindrales bacterium]